MQDSHLIVVDVVFLQLLLEIIGWLKVLLRLFTKKGDSSKINSLVKKKWTYISKKKFTETAAHKAFKLKIKREIYGPYKFFSSYLL